MPLVPKSGVIFPLYIYPAEGAWEPIYQTILAHPSVDFTIVINPANGPGAIDLPDENYTREIIRLNTFPNVRTIGYVPLDYGKRTLVDAQADIAKYAQWRLSNPDLAMQGIFLDETPQVATPSNTTLLANVKSRIRTTPQLESGAIGKIPFIVLNPGIIPDDGIIGTTDRTIVFEDQYQNYLNKQSAKALAALPDRSTLAVLMHSIPTDMPLDQLRPLINELRELAGTIFVTDIATHYYGTISPRLEEFMDCMV